MVFRQVGVMLVVGGAVGLILAIGVIEGRLRHASDVASLGSPAARGNSAVFLFGRRSYRMALGSGRRPTRAAQSFNFFSRMAGARV